MTTEIDVQVPRGWFALSNGALVKRDDKPNAKRWRYHWRMTEPQPSYLVTLVAGEFSEIDGGKAAGVPVTYLVPQGPRGGRQAHLPPHARDDRAFRQAHGRALPVEQIRAGGRQRLHLRRHGEHHRHDDVRAHPARRARRASTSPRDDLIAHELAHQWFGDYVTCRDWSHGWLNEGFATFYRASSTASTTSATTSTITACRTTSTPTSREAHGRYRRAIVCQDYEAPIDIFDRHLYEKGALVLHMLRRLLGDDAFFGGRARLPDAARAASSRRAI